MKTVHRSKRTRLSYRRHHRRHQQDQQVPKYITNDDDDESDGEREILQQKAVARSNKNANQMPLALFNAISNLPVENKPHETHPSSSDQSFLYLYSINSLPKPTAVSDDLTPLTHTATNTTALTVLTCSNSKLTETVKIDLTDLTSTDTLDISDRDHSLSLNRKRSAVDINNKIPICDTDTSMKSVVFSKMNSLDDQLSYQKHTSCFALPGIENTDSMTMGISTIQQNISLPTTINTNVNTYQRPPMRWNPSRWSLQNMTSNFKLLIGCSSLSLIAGIAILIIIL
ncbi:unnamed protein product [Adineta ricciae]|uniref:Uncharacterized protein n=1 Tax=Adineta ricciae TaxID=249248 RepID=A0A814ZS47_ADIRI|nr:unnamed protein product [Adineta ricciae]CAF1516023.1 unnamed protein product [Adineta ricciae]